MDQYEQLLCLCNASISASEPQVNLVGTCTLSSSQPNQAWIIDSGASSYIT